MIVIDAIENKDLELIASAITSIDEKLLYAGSSGLAGYLTDYLDIKKTKKINIIIAGSVSEVTFRQVEYLVEKSGIALIDVRVERLLNGERLKEKERIIDIIRKSSRKGEDIVIRSAASKQDVIKSVQEGERYGMSRTYVSEFVASFLGEIAQFVIQEIKINGIFITGGDTAIKAVNSLNISGTIIKDEILPGIPYSYFIEDRYKEITVVTKAGGFGKEDAIFQVLNFLNKR